MTNPYRLLIFYQAYFLCGHKQEIDPVYPNSGLLPDVVSDTHFHA